MLGLYGDSTITVSATVEERAFPQARVEMQPKRASAPVPCADTIRESLYAKNKRHNEFAVPF